MFLPLWRNCFQKLYPKIGYQYARNFNILAKSYAATNRSPILVKKFILINIIKRPQTTVTIAEYKTSRKFVNIWKLERVICWTLAFTIPWLFGAESIDFEMFAGTLALTHAYLGCQSMCSDYLRSAVVGKVLPLIARVFIVWITIASLAGTYQLVYEDVGIINMIKKFWSIRGIDYQPPTAVHNVKHVEKSK